MADDKYHPKGGGGSSYPGGKFPFAPICSPKETESADGVHRNTAETLPEGAAKPHK